MYSTSAARDALIVDLRLGPAMSRYTDLAWHTLRTAEPITLDGGLTATPIPVGTRHPRYVDQAEGDEWVIAYRFADRTDRGLVYAPCLPQWSPRLADHIAPEDVVLPDGTFFDASEMASAGRRGDARSMGHLPMRDSLPLLAGHPARQHLYTHINNTNPVAELDTEARQLIRAAGADIAEDGQLLRW